MRWLFFLLFPLCAHAQIYKWIDERGRIQYGEQPPPGVKAAPIREEAMPAGKPRPPEDFGREDAEFRRRQQARQRADEQAARQADARRRNCSSAKQRLAGAESSRRPYRLQGGERVYLTDAEQDARLAKLRAAVSEQCG